MLNIGILVFEDVEELDFTGPWEVFGMTNRVAAAAGAPDFCNLHLISQNMEPVRCSKGLKVLPDTTMESCSHLDVLLVPGGAGAHSGDHAAMKQPALLRWVARIAATSSWVTSVCSGAFVLCAAGPGQGKRVTTHHACIEMLREKGWAAEVAENVRYVVDGNLVTSAGVSAGIDMSLWLVGQLASPDFARKVQRAMQYEPDPPYQNLSE